MRLSFSRRRKTPIRAMSEHYPIPTVDFDRIEESNRISSPQWRTEDDGTRTRLLPYVDKKGGQRLPVTPVRMFKYAAGTNREGELPSGLDRVTESEFDVLMHGAIDTRSNLPKAVGLNVLPSRQFRRKAFPTELVTLSGNRIDHLRTVTVMFEVEGAVWDVISRPATMSVEALRLTLRNLRKAAAKHNDTLATKGRKTDDLIRKGKAIDGVGTIQDLTANSITYTPSVKAAQAAGGADPLGSLVEDEEP